MTALIYFTMGIAAGSPMVRRMSENGGKLTCRTARPAFAAALIFFLAGAAAAAELTAKINLKTDDGRFLIYAGSKDGVREGDYFEVRVKGETVGRLKAAKVGDFFTFAELVEGRAEEMDDVALAGRKDEKKEKEKADEGKDREKKDEQKAEK
ncbi:MAG: hypothetical protein AB1742_10730, partial [bacterium]